jgi:hypothetical protein
MKHKFSLPYFRARLQRSRETHYYLQLPNAGRQEIPLGSNLELAITRRTVHLFKHLHSAKGSLVNYGCILRWYLLIMVPLLPTHAGKENRNSIQKLTLFFEQTSFPIEERAGLEAHYKNWRGPQSTFRARREFSLFIRVLRWYDNMCVTHLPLTNSSPSMRSGEPRPIQCL